MFKTILVPTDGSQLSRLAEDAAIAFARANGATVVALAVAQQDALPAFPANTPHEHARDPGEAVALAQHWAADLARRAQLADIPSQCSVAVATSAYEEILKAASDFQCDAIFMASHGQHGIKDAFLGSQTQNVLVRTRLPVVVFR